MTYRTDLQMKNGKISVRDDSGVDTRHPLPEIQLTDRLATDKWGESLKSKAGKLSEDGALTGATLAHRLIVDGVHALKNQRDLQDPSLTQLNHLRQVSRNFTALIDKAASQSNRARTHAKERIDSIKKEFETSIGFTTKDSSEIRALIRGMDESQQTKFIDNAIETGDGNILASIFSSHPSLSGLDKTRSDIYYRQAMNAHHPDGKNLVEALEQADSLLSNTFNDLLLLEESLTATEARELHEKEAMRAHAAAEIANTAFR